MEARTPVTTTSNKKTVEVIMTNDQENMKNETSTEEPHVTIRQDLWSQRNQGPSVG